MQFSFRIVSTLILAGIACLPASALGQADQVVVVAVRAIKAKNSTEMKGSSAESSELSDLKEKLKRLKYEQLVLMSSQQKTVGLNEKESVSIGEGHTLYFRPVYKSDKRACLWLKWVDSSGMNVLDTRLHFDNGETVLTGTSNDDGSGIVLAIDVK